MKRAYLFLVFIIFFAQCKKDGPTATSNNLTIFFINDQHGQINHFSKIKHIIDLERQETDVLVTCSGDIFSGNPVVDNYPQKGYPMIDMMNKIGVDITAMGNHEFDYGVDILAERMEQADFKWVCSNTDMGTTGIPQPAGYQTLTVGDFRVTFLGLIETNGKKGATIPSTHPLKIQGIDFERPEEVVSRFSDVKEKEESDLYIALTHLGHDGNDYTMGDFQLAQQFPYFDLIIGGHSHRVLDTTVNNIPVIQAGNNLQFLGKIELNVQDKKVVGLNCEFINLNSYPDQDATLQEDIYNYDQAMADELDEVIGISDIFHTRNQVGCFYTDALREQLAVDLTFQNYGGIRSTLDQGDISVRDIYEIDPFDNGTIVFTMTVAEIKDFLMGSGSWYCYSGVEIEQQGSNIIIIDEGMILQDDVSLTLGINDYIPAVEDTYFPENGIIKPYTTAEYLISYLKNSNDAVYYPVCANYFRYQ